jgi:hypothetical protein
LEHVSLRKVAVESEYAGEELTEDNLSKSTEQGG